MSAQIFQCGFSTKRAGLKSIIIIISRVAVQREVEGGLVVLAYSVDGEDPVVGSAVVVKTALGGGPSRDGPIECAHSAVRVGGGDVARPYPVVHGGGRGLAIAAVALNSGGGENGPVETSTL